MAPKVMRVWFTIEIMLSVLLTNVRSVMGGLSNLLEVNIARSVVKIYWWWNSIAVRFDFNHDLDLLNNCVGIQNKRYYLLFLTYTSLTSSLMIYPLSLSSPSNNVTLFLFPFYSIPLFRLSFLTCRSSSTSPCPCFSWYWQLASGTLVFLSDSPCMNSWLQKST
jgi:hypothetical protein